MKVTGEAGNLVAGGIGLYAAIAGVALPGVGWVALGAAIASPVVNAVAASIGDNWYKAEVEALDMELCFNYRRLAANSVRKVTNCADSMPLLAQVSVGDGMRKMLGCK